MRDWLRGLRHFFGAADASANFAFGMAEPGVAGLSRKAPIEALHRAQHCPTDQLTPLFRIKALTSWRESSPAWLILASCCLALASASVLWDRNSQQEKSSALALKAQLEQSQKLTQRPVLLSAQDFARELPRVVDVQLAVDTLQRTAREAGVAVGSLSLRETLARADQLGRAELTVIAQGKYPALKQVLAEWLARFPSATMRSQQWRGMEAGGLASSGPTTVEASWVLSVWTRPLGLDSNVKTISKAAESAASATPSISGVKS